MPTPENSSAWKTFSMSRWAMTLPMVARRSPAMTTPCVCTTATMVVPWGASMWLVKAAGGGGRGAVGGVDVAGEAGGKLETAAGKEVGRVRGKEAGEGAAAGREERARQRSTVGGCVHALTLSRTGPDWGQGFAPGVTRRGTAGSRLR